MMPPPALEAVDAELATIEGGRSLGLSDRIGSIEGRASAPT
jgi:hypothetical protein